eukprot:TRINITY_DN971_c0_g1_i9.p1 TRINITY_DN971_c0_g1~~TRINITY_DN971_c0_g1_i9.p1  ORF type:complete len:473 (+),score=80.39 TRINITY_DN971_c0_g1_i9:467-1885(+)
MRWLLLFVVACLGSTVQADEEEFVASAIRPSNGIEWGTMAIRIVDDKNDPIGGVSVRPWALRAGNGHGAWNEELGSPKETFTDRHGETTVVYPKATLWGDGKPVTVSSVSLTLAHPEFVARSVHVNVPAGDTLVIPELTLKPGVRLRVAGVEPGTDKPLDHCHLLIENRDAGGIEFVREPDGWLQSNPISEDRRWFRVVHAPPGKPPRFSQLAAWTPEDPASRERRLEVRVGTRIQGRISENVMRPIERGHVVAWCGSPVRKNGQEQKNSSPIFWLETATIEVDGTFVFDSLPSGYLAQFYAFANDSISAQPTDAAYELACKWFNVEAREKHVVFRYGQTLRLVGSKSDLTIEMEPAGKVRIKCVDPDGNPVRGVTVSSWPNQFIVGAGSTVFCDRRSSLSSLQQTGLKYDWRETSPYVAKTDSDGIAIICNLPAGNQSFMASSDLWTSDHLNAEAVLDVPAEAEIKLQRIP